MSWDANSEPDLAGYRVYYSLTTQRYSAANSRDVGLKLTTTFDNLEEGRRYYFVVTAYDRAGNESAYSREVSATVPVVDRTPPQISTVNAIDQTTVAVAFNEAVTKASAENKSNYRIDPQIVIARATLQADNHTVLLKTSEHSNGKTYTITVQNVSDAAQPPNSINPAVSATYTFTGLDQAPPVVTYVGAVDAATVEVRFDEPVAAASAEKLDNYAISGGITISSIARHADNRGVHLKTSAHQDGASYLITVRNIADLAATPNVMPEAMTLAYTYRANDRQAPAVRAAALLDLTTLSVTFDERVTRASAEQVGNYRISDNVQVQSARLNAEATEVILTTSAHVYDHDYTLTVSGITDASANANVMSPTSVRYRLQQQGVDREAPVVTYVGAHDETTVEVRFNEAVTKASAENPANYSITRGITISGATLHLDGRGVHLKTSPHSDGETYELTVSGITDRAPVPNRMTGSATMAYTFRANDLDPPAALAAILSSDLLTVTVLFNEKVSAATATNPENYTISENVRVYSASLNAEGTEVTLATSLHWYDHTFTVTVRGIADASPNANVTVQPAVLRYSLGAPGQFPGGGLTISAWSRKEYQIDTLRAGKRLYIDRAHTITSVPKKFEGLLMFRTAYRDRRDRSQTFFEFNLNRAADVYIAYDPRGEPVPDWLANHFTRVNKTVLINGPTDQLQIWKAHYPPGRVQLGGNMAEGGRTDVALTMYFVFVDDLQGGRGGSSASVPRLFTLHQNFPNPFNLKAGHLQTEISYFLQQQGHVVLTIYNMLGQAVRTMQDGVLPPGLHRHVWNGLDNDFQALPSGKYLYVLEIREQVSNGVFTVTTALERQTKVMTLLK
ncbi:MAG: Ig-like domain-containing protein [candidate division KSB1 bacterium]|nr:Ig-like domain-containing protein [candidate division KSB1 bacterium]MDZ7273500.1 Ig-like domain-containing protein [candidate division KSB1 bacterium]MDZ7286909.1 Ig-like domain-containing protein [candidate division KSB1 bacterium]MDZ7299738.1 Ig-like domain-containing protein [candidate division KSB1 bacterium]MDZ7305677.1 Ig-like domain-containing protein [candidate division KSB1 bacterium]